MSVVTWAESNTGRKLNVEQGRCVSTLCAIAAPYNLPLIGDGWAGADDYDYDREAGEMSEFDAGLIEAPRRLPVEFGPTWMIARLRTSLSTFDNSDLTLLVLAAHEYCVRVDISAEAYLSIDTDSFLHRLVDGKWVETREHPSSAGSCLRVQLNARGLEGSIFERHPRIGDVLAKAPT